MKELKRILTVIVMAAVLSLSASQVLASGSERQQ